MQEAIEEFVQKIAFNDPEQIELLDNLVQKKKERQKTRLYSDIDAESIYSVIKQATPFNHNSEIDDEDEDS